MKTLPSAILQKKFWRKKANFWRETGEDTFRLLILTDLHFEDFAEKTYRLIKDSKKVVGNEKSLERTMKSYYNFLIEERGREARKFMAKHGCKTKK